MSLRRFCLTSGYKKLHLVSNDFWWIRFECNIVLDLGELSVSQLNSRTLNVIKEQAFIDSLCFPETMSKMVIINAPRFFSATWKIIKGWIDPRTANKIEIIASRKVWEKRLRELVDADNLPSDYGGTGPTSEKIILQDNTSGDVKRYHTELLSVRYVYCIPMSIFLKKIFLYSF